MIYQAHERNTELFKRLQDDLKENLQALRELNDKPSDPVKTAEIRGQIKEVKRRLKDMEPQAPSAPRTAKTYT